MREAAQKFAGNGINAAEGWYWLGLVKSKETDRMSSREQLSVCKVLTIYRITEWPESCTEWIGCFQRGHHCNVKPLAKLQTSSEGCHGRHRPISVTWYSKDTGRQERPKIVTTGSMNWRTSSKGRSEEMILVPLEMTVWKVDCRQWIKGTK